MKRTYNDIKKEVVEHICYNCNNQILKQNGNVHYLYNFKHLQKHRMLKEYLVGSFGIFSNLEL